MAPTVVEADNAFKNAFTGLLGISMSHHVDHSLSTAIHKSISDHRDKSPERVGAIIRSTTDRLKSKSKDMTARELKLYIDEAIDKDIV